MSKAIYQDGKPVVIGKSQEKEMEVENDYLLFAETKNVEWKDIENVNKEIKTIQIKRNEKDDTGKWVEAVKDYAPVNERIIAYRKLYPFGTISSTPNYTDKFIEVEAVVTDNKGKMLAQAHARENIGTQFALEKAETSAIGRAIGMIGIGVQTSISTADDMQNVEDSKIFDEPIHNIEKLVEEFESLYNLKDKTTILNGLHVTSVKEMGVELLLKYIDYAKHNSK